MTIPLPSAWSEDRYKWERRVDGLPVPLAAEPLNRAPNGEQLCCDQAVICWPHPCPWHRPRST